MEYKPTTTEEIADQIQYLHNLIYNEIEWANHIKTPPSKTKIDSLYAEIGDWEKKLNWLARCEEAHQQA
jgi:hypothetical protein